MKNEINANMKKKLKMKVDRYLTNYIFFIEKKIHLVVLVFNIDSFLEFCFYQSVKRYASEKDFSKTNSW